MNWHKLLLKSFIAMLLSTLPLAHAWGSDDISLHFQKSFEYEDVGNYPSALKEMLKIIKIASDNYTARLRAGWLYYLLGHHEDSIVQYRKSISLKPKAIEPRQGLMLPLMGSKRWKEAEAVAREALRFDSMNYTSNSRLAFVLYNIGRYGQASKLYRRILELYPADIEMQLGLAWTFVKMGKNGPARKWFRKVLSVKHSNPSAVAGIEAAR
jgi:tetratricopeptide (TPR) repeat protein